MSLTAGQLADELVRNQLVAADVLSTVRSQGGLTDDQGSAEPLARQLIKEGKLTLFQAQLAVNGRAKNLVLGSYEILDKLGQGGMGQVFRARHRTMKREVAIKIISSAVVRDATSLKRFQREVEAAARLTHANIVTSYDAGTCRGMHFLVMEYVRGRDLSTVVQSMGPLPVARAVHCVMQAAQAIAYAHGQGIVHRDIKPANLLIDETGLVKVLDMGLARFNGAAPADIGGLTATGMLMGTVDYMAPEQAMDSKTADGRSDIYSLGCTLYYLITGRPIYDDDAVMKRIMAHQSSAIPMLPIDDERLNLIFEKMVAKKAVHRFASADLLAAELGAWLSDHLDDECLRGVADSTVVPLAMLAMAGTHSGLTSISSKPVPMALAIGPDIVGDTESVGTRGKSSSVAVVPNDAMASVQSVDGANSRCSIQIDTSRPARKRDRKSSSTIMRAPSTIGSGHKSQGRGLRSWKWFAAIANIFGTLLVITAVWPS